ncbi:NTP transferase domain-containing protein [Candidatus Woesebacteria bacterium]|jgi:UTP--glucose-1-phosphate uridylyltransferase|nr:NTP transferase domain-containing protein [Candidatus Woesebacteria bacterium]HNV44834.1 sugar phosphate nucleotidyltransferase [Candidatus Woesebacteria bacterium]HOA12089.1 sugar phosphate nucleotidyltransferase [Candidatus Woesebacteria bacterium]HOC07463.1 sugar phosphate nucleotidyltransferase [Candidatus Woesebacteria bacterium]HOI04901.1 sugar phosphate nucleotidyltransferase [Candidatus Woesebacteria bacterium]
MKIRKAVITSAGFGTRFLPISKTIQKEMLPIINRPLIDYVVEDCVKAGITDIVFVVSEHNYQVLHYYRENQRLHQYLKDNNKLELYDLIKDLHTKANFHFIKQSDADDYGTAVPVQLAKEYLQDEEAFLVLMGDDFIYRHNGTSEVAAMMQTYEQSGAAALVTCIEKAESDLPRYGVAKLSEENNFRYLQALVEKPKPGTAPSNLANISKYILPQSVFDLIAVQQPNPASGELYITDTISQLALTEKVVIHQPQGEYLDGGYPLGWLIANLTVAKDHPELWAEIKRFVNQE